MEPADTPPISRSAKFDLRGDQFFSTLASISHAGANHPHGPRTARRPLIEVEAVCRDGKAERIRVRNVPSFADKLDVDLEIEGSGTVKVDTAYGGDSFVLVDAASLGLKLQPDQARDLAQTGMRITKAANEQLGFRHPNKDWNHISFCQFTDPVGVRDGVLTGKNAVAIRPGKIDRSPTGTGCSARMAVLHAKGQLKVGEPFIGTSLIDTAFHCSIDSEVDIGRPAIRPVISGRAWVVGTAQLMGRARLIRSRPATASIGYMANESLTVPCQFGAAFSYRWFSIESA